MTLAGPLTPPAGPVAPTPGPEPRIAVNATNTPGDNNSVFVITQPGSYYLTANVIGQASKSGIRIVSSGVTLDLNGFEVIGPEQFSGDGVTVANGGDPRNIAVFNGSVRGWKRHGIFLGFPNVAGGRVENVTVSGNGECGIMVGYSSTVVNCTASFNGSRGIEASDGAKILECSAHLNQNGGIVLAADGIVSRCTALFNAQSGITVGTGSSALDSTASTTDAGPGFVLGELASAHRCTAQRNTTAGFNAAAGCVLNECDATGNFTNGIQGGASVRVVNSTARRNTLDGITVGVGSTVSGCTATENTTNGIRGLSSCVIRGNTCAGNGAGAGSGSNIRVEGADSHIEANVCTGADRGIEVIAAGNLIIRNTCANNGVNWTIAANNSYGPIIDRTAPVSAAVNGNSAADAAGSTHPNANFTY
ncbi:MAG: right-handed parallel beta-helix repeat-containing protein [Phycisphaerales bacterium]